MSRVALAGLEHLSTRDDAVLRQQDLVHAHATHDRRVWPLRVDGYAGSVDNVSNGPDCADISTARRHLALSAALALTQGMSVRSPTWTT